MHSLVLATFTDSTIAALMQTQTSVCCCLHELKMAATAYETRVEAVADSYFQVGGSFLVRL